MGELLRRYWHPIGLATDPDDIPEKSVRPARTLFCSVTGMAGMAGTLAAGLMVAQISSRDDRWKL
jgi:hypothetical protein